MYDSQVGREDKVCTLKVWLGTIEMENEVKLKALYSDDGGKYTHTLGSPPWGNMTVHTQAQGHRREGKNSYRFKDTFCETHRKRPNVIWFLTINLWNWYPFQNQSRYFHDLCSIPLKISHSLYFVVGYWKQIPSWIVNINLMLFKLKFAFESPNQRYKVQLMSRDSCSNRE